MKTAKLNTQLDTLQQAAKDQTSAYESSREKLYQNIVDTYLWWRAAEQETGYLRDKFKEGGIRTRKKKSNKPNFYPVVRLVWNIDISKKASTVSEWAQSLLAVHDVYTENPARFSQNARSNLINFIHDAGGLSELRGERRMSEQELFDEEDADLIEDKKPAKAPVYGSKEAIVQTKSALAKTSAAKASLPMFANAVVNADDFIVMLARRNPTTNELEIIGSDFNEDLVESALLACADINRTSVTPSLRLIAEALMPHAVPAKLEKYRKKFFDRSKSVKRLQDDGTTEKVYESTSLFIQPASNEIVVTKTPKRVNCVTHIKPKTLILHDGNPLVLRGADRTWIERELIGNQQLPLYTAEPADQLAENSTDKLTRYALNLSSKANRHSRSLYFYVSDEMPDDTAKGMQISDDIKLDSDWEITASSQWLAEFEAACVGQWIAGVKSHFNKPQNKKIAISANKSQLTLWFWWDDEKSQYEKSSAIDFGSAAKIDISKNTGAVELYPKDAMLLFSAIPSLPLAANQISIKRIEAGLLVEYETDLAKYRSLLPNYDAYVQDEANKAKKLKPKNAVSKRSSKKTKPE